MEDVAPPSANELGQAVHPEASMEDVVSPTVQGASGEHALSFGQAIAMPAGFVTCASICWLGCWLAAVLIIRRQRRDARLAGSTFGTLHKRHAAQEPRQEQPQCRASSDIELAPQTTAVESVRVQGTDAGMDVDGLAAAPPQECTSEVSEERAPTLPSARELRAPMSKKKTLRLARDMSRQLASDIHQNVGKHQVHKKYSHLDEPERGRFGTQHE